MQSERDFETLLDDVKTIKSILQSEDAPFPRMWLVAWIVATAVLTAGLLQYFLPFYRRANFDTLMLTLWIPGFCVVFPTALFVLYREIGRIGKRFLGQSRIRHLLFARFLIPPAALVLIWVSSRNTEFGVEGVILLVAAMWQTAIEQALPEEFRPMPFVFLFLGLAELGLHWTGPEVTLGNAVLVAATVAYAGYLFWAREKKKAGV